MGEEAAMGAGEAAAKGLAEAGPEIGAGAGELAAGAGDFLSGAGDVASGLGAGGGELAGAGGGGYAFDPGFSSDAFDYLSGGAGALNPSDVAAGTGAGFDPSIGTGSSAFDPGSYSGGSSTPDWLNGGTTFDTGVVGATSPFDFSGGVDSFASGNGVSSIADSAAAGASAPQNITAFQTGSGFGGEAAASPFSPPSNVTAPDISAIDPTATGGTSGATDFSSVNRSAGGNVDLSGLDAAQSSAANQYGAATAPSVPTAPGEVAAAVPAATAPAAGTATTPAAAAAAPSNTFLGMEVGKPTLFGTGSALLSGGLLAKNLLSNSVPGQDQVNALKSTIPQIQSTIDSVNKTAEQLRNSTQPLTAEAQEMMSYVSKGTLPPAMQTQVKAGTDAAKAQAASIMAQHGLSADPAHNAQLKQQFDTIDSQALQLQATMAKQLYDSGLQAIQAANQTQSVAASLTNTGVNAVGLTQNTYLALQKIYADQDKQQQQAIANFAGALGKISGGAGGGGTTIKIGGS